MGGNLHLLLDAQLAKGERVLILLGVLLNPGGGPADKVGGENGQRIPPAKKKRALRGSSPVSRLFIYPPPLHSSSVTEPTVSACNFQTLHLLHVIFFSKIRCRPMSLIE